MSIDKLAPQAVEAEQSVLGSILIDSEAILKVGDFLHPADFYRQQHADIYEAMLALHGQREPIDLVTLGDELARRERLEQVGGPAYLATLMDAVPTAVHVEHYGRIVERKAVLRFAPDGLVLEQRDTWNQADGHRKPPEGWGR